MKARGRDSPSERHARETLPAPLERVARPDAPYDLTDEQSAEWWAIVNSMPAEHFPRETHPLLAQICRHTIRARRLAQLANEMEKSDTFDVGEYCKLVDAETKQSQALGILATKMRLSQQSFQDRTIKRAIRASRKPWEPHEG